jgi:3-oxoacid CoA-transferase
LHQGKIVRTADEAVKDVKSGNLLLFGGFGLCGIPMNLIEALARRREVTGLVIASNDGGSGDING